MTHTAAPAAVAREGRFASATTTPRVVTNRAGARTIVASALVLFILGDAAQARVGGVTRPAYALTLMVVAVALLLTRNARGPTRAVGNRLALGAVVFGAFSSLPSFLEPNLSLAWFVGDLAGILMVAFVATLATRLPGDLHTFGGPILVAGVLGSVLALGTSSPDINRLEPPVVLAMTIGAYLTWGRGPKLPGRLVGVVSSVVFLIATLQSGYRWSFAQIILIHLLVAGARLLRTRSLGALAVSLIAVVVAISYLAFGGAVRTDNLAESPTIERIIKATKGIDPSTDERVADSADALAYLGESGLFNWLVGFGHGAAYPVLTSRYLAEDEHGRFHSIHIGPVRVLFRYGLIGLVLHLVVAARIASWAVRELALRAGTGTAVLPVAALVLLLDFLVLNPLISAVDAAVLGCCWGLATIKRVINRQPAAAHPSSSWSL